MDEAKTQVKARASPLSNLLTRRIKDYETTPSEASREAGLHSDEINKIIKGRRTDISGRTRAGICRALEIDPEYLDEAIRATIRAG